jgi:hypothetical protein
MSLLYVPQLDTLVCSLLKPVEHFDVCLKIWLWCIFTVWTDLDTVLMLLVSLIFLHIHSFLH